MNKVIRKIGINAIFLCAFIQAHQRGQSVLFVQPPFQSGSPERESLLRFPPECHQLSFVQFVPLGSWIAGSQEIPSFFLPFGMTNLTVTEDGNKDAAMRDIDAAHLNIKTIEGSFKSNLIFTAKQNVSGFGMAWRQQIAEYWWFEIGSPYVKVENRFHFKELVRNDGGGVQQGNGLDGAPFVANATQGFKQPSWKYGKINCKLNLVKEGLADIELKLGYQPYASRCLRMYGYGGFLIPTGNRPTGAYVFEPIVGNGHHYGVFYGSHLGVNIWDYNEHHLASLFDIHTRYLFGSHEIRSFDLKDKEYSRYISTYASPRQAELAAATHNINSGTSGINIFTQPVNVFPGYSLTLLGALAYTNERLLLELGYGFFAKQAERVEIDWVKTSAVKDATGEGKTNPFRTIKENIACAAVEVGDYKELLPKNIDPISASNQALIQYTFYASGGYYVCEGNYPVLIGLGASYETTANTAFNKYSLWAKIDVRY